MATGIDASGNVVGYAYNSSPQGVEIPADAIAVVFAPAQGSPTALASLSLSATDVAPGVIVQATVVIPTAAPVGGLSIFFLSTLIAVLPTPSAVVIPSGQTCASLSLSIGGAALQTPVTLRLLASDGTVSKTVPLTVTPVVNLSSLTVNPVEGGFATTGTIALGIPASFRLSPAPVVSVSTLTFSFPSVVGG